MALSSAINVVGEAGITRLKTPCSMSPVSCSSAALKNVSPGRNITTNSGVESNCSQYFLLLRVLICSRTWRA